MAKKNNMLKNVNTDYYLNFIKDDPVRPHLPMLWRVQNNREVYVLEDPETSTVEAMICVAYTNEVPKDEGELELFSTLVGPDSPRGHIAIFYTVWSYVPGSGRDIVLGLAKHIKDTMPVTRFVTMSPMTNMARGFHLKNGAAVLQVNSTSVNYEYKFEE
jgi:hypothetical protein